MDFTNGMKRGDRWKSSFQKEQITLYCLSKVALMVIRDEAVRIGPNMIVNKMLIKLITRDCWQIPRRNKSNENYVAWDYKGYERSMGPRERMKTLGADRRFSPWPLHESTNGRQTQESPCHCQCLGWDNTSLTECRLGPGYGARDQDYAPITTWNGNWSNRVFGGPRFYSAATRDWFLLRFHSGLSLDRWRRFLTSVERSLFSLVQFQRPQGSMEDTLSWFVRFSSSLRADKLRRRRGVGRKRRRKQPRPPLKANWGRHLREAASGSGDCRRRRHWCQSQSCRRLLPNRRRNRNRARGESNGLKWRRAGEWKFAMKGRDETNDETRFSSVDCTHSLYATHGVHPWASIYSVPFSLYPDIARYLPRVARSHLEKRVKQSSSTHLVHLRRLLHLLQIWLVWILFADFGTKLSPEKRQKGEDEESKNNGHHKLVKSLPWCLWKWGNPRKYDSLNEDTWKCKWKGQDDSIERCKGEKRARCQYTIEKKTESGKGVG